MIRSGVAALLCWGMLASSAHALCEYDRVANAKTTVEQEYQDSKWVVRIRILSADDHFSDSDPDAPYTLYKLEVLQAFKGVPPKMLSFFTRRSSAGFYFDKPWTGHDIGGEYLVFLNPNSPYPGQPPVEKGTVFVNYACGQSKPWSTVLPSERKILLDSKAGQGKQYP